MHNDWYEIPGMPGYYTLTNEAREKMLVNYNEKGRALANEILKKINKKDPTPTNEDQELL
jgi:hypothetical protein